VLAGKSQEIFMAAVEITIMLTYPGFTLPQSGNEPVACSDISE
jgi:hypothetical protein